MNFFPWCNRPLSAKCPQWKFNFQMVSKIYYIIIVMDIVRNHLNPSSISNMKTLKIVKRQRVDFFWHQPALLTFFDLSNSTRPWAWFNRHDHLSVVFEYLNYLNSGKGPFGVQNLDLVFHRDEKYKYTVFICLLLFRFDM